MRHFPMKRRLAIAAAALALAPLSGLAQTAAAGAAAWPTRPIKLIVPFAPGGSNDILARALATKLTQYYGQSVIVENKAGGGGTTGTEFVAKSAPDGYTIMIASGSLTTNAASGKKLGYDPVKDLTPIGMIGATPFVIVVGNDVKANTLGDFLTLARAKPGAVNYGTAGIGGINHLGTELFSAAAKIQMTHVPYKGIGPAFTDHMGGQLQMSLPTLASALPHIRSGKMRALAVTSAQRSPIAPEIPTVAEAGLPGFKLEVWFGLLGPGNLPPAVLKRLNEGLNAVLSQPELKELLAREAATTRPGTPDEFGVEVRSEIVRWTKLISDAKIQVE
jgi:tripartite-type tricarboxylate transporter receptor subunit TctC